MGVRMSVEQNDAGATCRRGLHRARSARRLAAALAATILLTAPALADQQRHPPYPDVLTGFARVVDGDTLVIDSVRVRLEGIDAPESDQTCGRSGGGTWDCGSAASGELRRLIAGSAVTCANAGVDKYGRMLGHCRTGAIDLNAQMVRGGYAWAFVRYSRAYVADEQSARQAHLGIWQGEAMPAWDWRASRWQAEAALAPSGCAIKGNVSRAGHVYHMPWSPHYAKVRMDKRRGERWFCSEADAQAAGWRAARAW